MEHLRITGKPGHSENPHANIARTGRPRAAWVLGAATAAVARAVVVRAMVVRAVAVRVVAARVEVLRV